LSLIELTTRELGCYQILAAGMVMVAVGYIGWFFYDYASHEH